MKMQLSCRCCSLTYGQFPSLVDVQVLPTELGTEEATNWTRIDWDRHDLYATFSWVGTIPASTQATPIRYTYNLDLTQNWNPLNTVWFRGFIGQSSWGSFPTSVPASPRHIDTVSLRHGGYTQFAGFSRDSIPRHPVNRFRVWVDGVDVTGIVDDSGSTGLIDLGLSFSKAEPYKQVFIEVDIWFAPVPGEGTIQIPFGIATTRDPRILFDYEFRNDLSIPCSVTSSFAAGPWLRDVSATISHDSVWGTHYPTGNELIPFTCEIPSGYRSKTTIFPDPIPGPFPTVGIWENTDTPEVMARAMSSQSNGQWQSATTSTTATVTKV